ncbi:DUF2306 domain-containing protein [Pseudonocardia sp. WMMC193]|uniref:DUF2306 domain-containing protein n=1 Tax=Pseudonocardia sp. WMMC193 TaxID=2911965 RepID=UPI001F471482|nr:DUF2306 domain-containing protein [Pseudonocardia sp. WMMC193]MCF7547849.1 DUF2306 domain-containing protein [Pseudonocardia sp. WMMC193]
MRTDSSPVRRDPRRVRIGLGVFAVVVLVFLAFSLPPYLGLDPARSRITPRPDYPLHYPLLVAHIGFGTIALVTAVLQIWPWLRRTHPTAHRWVGRVYLFGGVFPGGIVVLGVSPVSTTGLASAAGNTILALLWLGTAWAGWRAARERRFADHRRWMIRSVALTFSIVVNRVWIGVYLGLFALASPLDDATVLAAGAASVWSSWIVNLLVAEWWLLRPKRARARSGVA